MRDTIFPGKCTERKLKETRHLPANITFIARETYFSIRNYNKDNFQVYPRLIIQRSPNSPLGEWINDELFSALKSCVMR